MTGSEFFFGSGAAAYNVENAVQVNSADSEHMSLTFGTPTNAKKWSFSFFTERSTLSTNQSILSAGSAGGYARSNIGFESDNQFRFNFDAASGTFYVATTPTYTSTSDFLHVLVEYDSDNATASDRIRLYFDKVRETSLSGTTYPSSGQTIDFNTATAHNLFRRLSSGPTWYSDGIFSEVAFLDGSTPGPDAFVDDNILPVDLTGLSFGNNGFWQRYNDEDALGDDYSGNGNDWTLGNISSADQVQDTPTS